MYVDSGSGRVFGTAFQVPQADVEQEVNLVKKTIEFLAALGF